VTLLGAKRRRKSTTLRAHFSFAKLLPRHPSRQSSPPRTGAIVRYAFRTFRKGGGYPGLTVKETYAARRTAGSRVRSCRARRRDVRPVPDIARCNALGWTLPRSVADGRVARGLMASRGCVLDEPSLASRPSSCRRCSGSFRNQKDTTVLLVEQKRADGTFRRRPRFVLETADVLAEVRRIGQRAIAAAYPAGTARSAPDQLRSVRFRRYVRKNAGLRAAALA